MGITRNSQYDANDNPVIAGSFASYYRVSMGKYISGRGGLLRTRDFRFKGILRGKEREYLIFGYLQKGNLVMFLADDQGNLLGASGKNSRNKQGLSPVYAIDLTGANKVGNVSFGAIEFQTSPDVIENIKQNVSFKESFLSGNALEFYRMFNIAFDSNQLSTEEPKEMEEIVSTILGAQASVAHCMVRQ